MEVLFLIIYTKYFWDFDMWPFNGVGGPLNGGSTVNIVFCSLSLFTCSQLATCILKTSSYSTDFGK